MTLTVLTDDQIRSLLENLTLAELEGFIGALASALHEHSTGAEGETAIHQPQRISVHSAATEATTLFMPSCNSSGNGIKVITLSSAAATATTTTPTTTDTTPAKPIIRPTGAITLFTPAGEPVGLLHASALTAFRTALASLTLIRRRALPARAATLAVFGCGEQAYWHARLALLARGPDVKRVVFVNRRRSEACGAVAGRFADGVRAGKRREEGWEGCEFAVLTREDDGYAGKLAGVLREADVVICCTPSTEPLFDAALLGGGGKGRLVVAIGSYTPEMREVPAGLVKQAIAVGEREAGVVVVDTIEGALEEAGELIELGVKREQLVELGELVMLKEDGDKHKDTKRGNLVQWLQAGNVIYKSVGLGLMDLSVGLHVIEFAKQKGVGTHVQGF